MSDHETPDAGEGLSESEWEVITEASWKGGSDAWRAAVERIIADRVQTAEAERDGWRLSQNRTHDRMVKRVDTAVAERDEARQQLAEQTAAVEAVLDQLDLTVKQIKEQGDVRQVLLDGDGVGEAPTLGDELWAIAFNLRTALANPTTLDAVRAEAKAGVCDMGCQPDWHRDGCGIYRAALDTTGGESE